MNVYKIPCRCLDVMLGADSGNQSQTSDQPRWLEKVLLTNWVTLQTDIHHQEHPHMQNVHTWRLPKDMAGEGRWI